MPDSPFLDTMERVPRRGGQLWRRSDGERYYTWDPLHRHVEVFDKRGRHRGVADRVTGKLIKPAVKGRKIDV